MKRILLVIAVLITAAIIFPFAVGAESDAEIIISVEDEILSDRAFDVDIIFSDNVSVKGGSAELFFDAELLEVKSVSLAEKTSDESFSYNNKGSSIKFNFTCYKNEFDSRIVRVRFSPLNKNERESCRFHISDGCICRDSDTIIYPANIPSAETALINAASEEEAEEINESSAEISGSKKKNNSSEESGRTANIIYIQEKSEGAPVSQIIFLSVFGTGIVIVVSVLIISKIVRRKNR